MKYVRVYTDGDGETHFEDVTVPMAEETYAGARWQIADPVAVRDLRFRHVIDEYPDEPHVAPRRQFIVLLSGECEMEVSDGEVRRFGPGSVILVEDVTGKGHTTRRIGDAERDTLFLPLED